MNTYTRAAVTALAGVIACGKPQAAPTYEAVPVSRRTVVVSASASGAIEPVLTVDVKSKASGEIIEMNVQTGDDVKAGQLLASIDPRIPRNNLAQAQANLQVAQAQLANAKAQLARSDTLFKAQAITQTEYDQATLDHANANASVIRAQSDLENARDRMNDTKLRAPLAGTIITKSVELGTVISSPTTDVGGGTVLVRIPNPNHLLKPGMNTEVEIHVGRRDDVVAIPNAALRTQRDVASAAQVLGLDPNDVQQQLAAARQQTATRDSASLGGGAGGAGGAGGEGGSAPLTITLPDGRTVPVPPGIPAAQVRLAQSAMQKRQRGETPSDEERAAVRALFTAMGGGGGGGGSLLITGR